MQKNGKSDPGSKRCPILVLGIGNILLRDEGVGIHVIRQLAQRELPDGVEIFDGGTAGADLLDVIADRKKVIVVDALDADCKPATVMRFTLDPSEKLTPVTGSLHNLGIAETVAMTAQLNCAPEQVVVFGVKPASLEPGLELSHQVAATIPEITELVLQECTC